MKRALTLLLALTLGLAASGEDSPMVAAAKKANRKGKKPANVITNETLAKSGANAHVTTTAEQKPFAAPKPYVAPKPTPEMVAQQKRDDAKRKAEAETAQKIKAEEAKNQANEAAGAAAEEGLFEDEEAGTTTQKPPQR